MQASAGVIVVGVIRTPCPARRDGLRQGWSNGPICRIDIADSRRPAPKGVAAYECVEPLYCLDQGRGAVADGDGGP